MLVVCVPSTTLWLIQSRQPDILVLNILMVHPHPTDIIFFIHCLLITSLTRFSPGGLRPSHLSLPLYLCRYCDLCLCFCLVSLSLFLSLSFSFSLYIERTRPTVQSYFSIAAILSAKLHCSAFSSSPPSASFHHDIITTLLNLLFSLRTYIKLSPCLPFLSLQPPPHLYLSPRPWSTWCQSVHVLHPSSALRGGAVGLPSAQALHC